MAFFRRSREQAPSPPVQDLEDSDADVAPDDLGPGSTDDLAEDDDHDRAWRRRAAAVIPGGASTGSKRAEALFGDEDAGGPAHFIRAHGCTITTAAGEPLIDCTMALGAVSLGYAEPAVTHAVVQAATNGNVAGLSDIREVEVAERLTDLIPCAEQVRFLKTGAEAVSAAVRIARTYTGRSRVIASGYLGWHDWASETTGGVPAGARADVVRVPFDDVAALERAAGNGGELAAIVLEPVVERLPSEEWIAAARRHCDRLGAVLIFDEMKTGFRLKPGGYQELSGVTPDLAAFGKALANGYPLAAVVGRRDVMDAARRTWISSTLASEGTALAAAGAVLDWHERAEVCEALWTTGREMRDAVEAAVRASGVEGVDVDGIDPMWLLRFDDPAREARFLALARAEGVLFKRGAYNFASLAHDADIITDIERAASSAFVALREEEGD
jgi:glutamate-1-semialdehyde aminotransferase